MSELSDITIAIKTFERPDCLQECLVSIRKMYPQIKIIVADDSLTPQKNDLADEYFFLPHDSGLSYGRNFLLDKVKTKYTMIIDDDTIFVTKKCIEMIKKILDNNEDINLVAGNIKFNNYKGVFEKKEDTLYKVIGKHSKVINNNKIYDFVVNLFIAETDKLRKVKWDKNLKICEHTNFFYRSLGILNNSVCLDSLFLNSSKLNPTYKKFRRDRINEYSQKQCESLNVKKILETIWTEK